MITLYTVGPSFDMPDDRPFAVETGSLIWFRITDPRRAVTEVRDVEQDKFGDDGGMTRVGGWRASGASLDGRVGGH